MTQKLRNEVPQKRARKVWPYANRFSRHTARNIFQPARPFIPSKTSLSTVSPPTSDGYAQKPTVLNNAGADPSRNNTNRTLEFLFLTLSLAAEASREILKLDMCFQRCLFRVLRRAVGAEDTNSGVLGKSACLTSFGLNLPSLTPFFKAGNRAAKTRLLP